MTYSGFLTRLVICVRPSVRMAKCFGGTPGDLVNQRKRSSWRLQRARYWWKLNGVQYWSWPNQIFGRHRARYRIVHQHRNQKQITVSPFTTKALVSTGPIYGMNVTHCTSSSWRSVTGPHGSGSRTWRRQSWLPSTTPRTWLPAAGRQPAVVYFMSHAWTV